MFERLQARLTLLFFAFVFLVVISIGATYWGLQTQRQDALIINLAGRQRMLVQQMTRLALQLQNGDETTLSDLEESEQIFSQTLSALRDGGTAPYLSDSLVSLPLTRNPKLRSALDEVEVAWKQYRSTLVEIDFLGVDPVLLLEFQPIFERQSDNLVQKADVVVRLYEAASTAKVNRLRAIQVAFLACALALLAVGAWITRQSLLQPLQSLRVAAKRLGENNLDTPVQVQGPTEMQTLSQAFDDMRSRLRSAREELVQWNATLEQRVSQRTHELEALNEVSREISSRLDIQQVLNSVTEKARSLLGGEVASLCLLDESQHWLKLQTMSGPGEAVVGEVVSTSNSPTDAILQGEQALHCGIGACQGGCAILSETYRASHLAAPLRIGERVIGALCVGSPAQQKFAAESANMLTKLANTAAIALENARLYAQAERVATLEERHRIAAEMHDGLGQTLSYLGLMTDQVVDFLAEGQDEAAMQRLQHTRETIEEATGKVRQAIDRLMDESSFNLDLRKRLCEEVDLFNSRHSSMAHWQSDIHEPLLCPPDLAEQVLNVLREALNNAAQHAHANHISVRMEHADGMYFVLIEDDGQGFDVSQPSPNGHFGLRIMHARAERIGGQLEINSQPGHGTSIRLIWPENVSVQVR